MDAEMHSAPPHHPPLVRHWTESDAMSSRFDNIGQEARYSEDHAPSTISASASSAMQPPIQRQLSDGEVMRAAATGRLRSIGSNIGHATMPIRYSSHTPRGSMGGYCYAVSQPMPISASTSSSHSATSIAHPTANDVTAGVIGSSMDMDVNVEMGDSVAEETSLDDGSTIETDANENADADADADADDAQRSISPDTADIESGELAAIAAPTFQDSISKWLERSRMRKKQQQQQQQQKQEGGRQAHSSYSFPLSRSLSTLPSPGRHSRSSSLAGGSSAPTPLSIPFQHSVSGTRVSHAFKFECALGMAPQSRRSSGRMSRTITPAENPARTAHTANVQPYTQEQLVHAQAPAQVQAQGNKASARMDSDGMHRTRVRLNDSTTSSNDPALCSVAASDSSSQQHTAETSATASHRGEQLLNDSTTLSSSSSSGMTVTLGVIRDDDASSSSTVLATTRAAPFQSTSSSPPEQRSLPLAADATSAESDSTQLWLSPPQARPAATSLSSNSNTESFSPNYVTSYGNGGRGATTALSSSSSSSCLSKASSLEDAWRRKILMDMCGERGMAASDMSGATSNIRSPLKAYGWDSQNRSPPHTPCMVDPTSNYPDVPPLTLSAQSNAVLDAAPPIARLPSDSDASNQGSTNGNGGVTAASQPPASFFSRAPSVRGSPTVGSSSNRPSPNTSGLSSSDMDDLDWPDAMCLTGTDLDKNEADSAALVQEYQSVVKMAAADAGSLDDRIRDLEARKTLTLRIRRVGWATILAAAGACLASIVRLAVAGQGLISAQAICYFLLFIVLLLVCPYAGRQTKWFKPLPLLPLSTLQHGLAACTGLVCCVLFIGSLELGGATSLTPSLPTLEGWTLWMLCCLPLYVCYINSTQARVATMWSIIAAAILILSHIINRFVISPNLESTTSKDTTSDAAVWAHQRHDLWYIALIVQLAFLALNHHFSQSSLQSLQDHVVQLWAREQFMLEQGKALALQREQAFSTANQKAQILANTSHEIRTPLNGIIGLCSLVLETELTADQRDLLTTVIKSGEMLLCCVNDILLFSKLESGELLMEELPFSPMNAVEDVLDVFALTAQQHQVELIPHFKAGLVDTCYGDSMRLRQVLTNLLSNAIRFSKKGGEVVVSVEPYSPAAHELLPRPSPRHRTSATDSQSNEDERASRSASQRDLVKQSRNDAPDEHEQKQTDHIYLKFSVQDSGCGIPKSKHHRLFRAFSQVDASDTRKHGGTGLGLVICKRLVELMCGGIGFESEYGKGSTFWFFIKLATTMPNPNDDLDRMVGATSNGMVNPSAPPAPSPRHARVTGDSVLDSLPPATVETNTNVHPSSVAAHGTGTGTGAGTAGSSMPHRQSSGGATTASATTPSPSRKLCLKVDVSSVAHSDVAVQIVTPCLQKSNSESTPPTVTTDPTASRAISAPLATSESTMSFASQMSPSHTAVNAMSQSLNRLGSRLNGKRVLIVDKQRSGAAMVDLMTSKWGMRCKLVTQAAEWEMEWDNILKHAIGKKQESQQPLVSASSPVPASPTAALRPVQVQEPKNMNNSAQEHIHTQPSDSTPLSPCTPARESAYDIVLVLDEICGTNFAPYDMIHPLYMAQHGARETTNPSQRTPPSAPTYETSSHSPTRPPLHGPAMLRMERFQLDRDRERDSATLASICTTTTSSTHISPLSSGRRLTMVEHGSGSVSAVQSVSSPMRLRTINTQQIRTGVSVPSSTVIPLAHTGQNTILGSPPPLKSNRSDGQTLADAFHTAHQDMRVMAATLSDERAPSPITLPAAAIPNPSLLPVLPVFILLMSRSSPAASARLDVSRDARQRGFQEVLLKPCKWRGMMQALLRTSKFKPPTHIWHKYHAHHTSSPHTMPMGTPGSSPATCMALGPPAADGCTTLALMRSQSRVSASFAHHPIFALTNYNHSANASPHDSPCHQHSRGHSRAPSYVNNPDQTPAPPFATPSTSNHGVIDVRTQQLKVTLPRNVPAHELSHRAVTASRRMTMGTPVAGAAAQAYIHTATPYAATDDQVIQTPNPNTGATPCVANLSRQPDGAVDIKTSSALHSPPARSLPCASSSHGRALSSSAPVHTAGLSVKSTSVNSGSPMTAPATVTTLPTPIPSSTPLAAPSPSPAPRRATTATTRTKSMSMTRQPPANSSLRILVTEDVVINQKVMLRMLQHLGYRNIAIANDGVECLQYLAATNQHKLPPGQQHAFTPCFPSFSSSSSTCTPSLPLPFDLVLLDKSMPRLGGLSTARRIRQRMCPHLQPRLIAVTANVLPADHEQCLQLGMDFLPKPVLLAQLKQMLEQCKPLEPDQIMRQDKKHESMATMTTTATAAHPSLSLASPTQALNSPDSINMSGNDGVGAAASMHSPFTPPSNMPSSTSTAPTKLTHEYRCCCQALWTEEDRRKENQTEQE